MTTPDLVTITITRDDLITLTIALSTLSVLNTILDDDFYNALGRRSEDFRSANRRIIDTYQEANEQTTNEGHPQ